MRIMNVVLKGVKNPKKSLSVVKHHLLSTIGNNQYRRFVVLSRSRTGSNLIISLLNSNPHINAEREIFSKLNGKNYKEVLAKAFDKEPFYIKAKGFKIFYYHAQDDDSRGVWDELQSMEGLHVIHLKRRNVLQTLISNKIAEYQDVWEVTSDRQNSSLLKDQVSITFTVDEMNEGFKRTKKWEEAGDKMFKNHRLLSIDYEELVIDRTKEIRKITEFLGVDYSQTKTELKKQNSRSMRETIKNYDELKASFSQTEWGHFFED